MSGAKGSALGADSDVEYAREAAAYLAAKFGHTLPPVGTKDQIRNAAIRTPALPWTDEDAAIFTAQARRRPAEAGYRIGYSAACDRASREQMLGREIDRLFGERR